MLTAVSAAGLLSRPRAAPNPEPVHAARRPEADSDERGMRIRTRRGAAAAAAANPDPDPRSAAAAEAEPSTEPGDELRRRVKRRRAGRERGRGERARGSPQGAARASTGLHKMLLRAGCRVPWSDLLGQYALYVI